MEQWFIEIMNAILPGLGKFIAFLTVGGGLGAGAFKGIMSIKKMYDNRLLKQKEKEDEEADFKNQMRGLITTVNDLKTNVDDIRNTITSNREEHDCEFNRIAKALESSSNEMKDVAKQVNRLKSTTDLLLKSEMEDIRAFITSEYFKWTDEGYIDINAMKTVEDRYSSYLAANGNTFVSDLVHELRLLEKKHYVDPSKLKSRQQTNTNHFTEE